jgi:hypothetical protein
MSTDYDILKIERVGMFRWEAVVRTSYIVMYFYGYSKGAVRRKIVRHLGK